MKVALYSETGKIIKSWKNVVNFNTEDTIDDFVSIETEDDKIIDIKGGIIIIENNLNGEIK